MERGCPLLPGAQRGGLDKVHGYSGREQGRREKVEKIRDQEMGERGDRETARRSQRERTDRERQRDRD